MLSSHLQSEEGQPIHWFVISNGSKPFGVFPKGANSVASFQVSSCYN